MEGILTCAIKSCSSILLAFACRLLLADEEGKFTSTLYWTMSALVGTK